jgi:hypothetical protein
MRLGDFNRLLTFRAEAWRGASNRMGSAMHDISWGDLDSDEKRAIAMLAAGVSVKFCDSAALLTLISIGLIKGSRLTPVGERLRTEGLEELAA